MIRRALQGSPRSPRRPRAPRQTLGALALAIAAVAACALAAPPARAERAMGGEDLGAAQLHFDWGIHHVQNERWREALAEFDASIAAVPNRSALFNRALCLQNLGLYSESIRAFEEYLAFLGDGADESARSEALGHIEAMREGSRLVNFT